MSIMVLPPEEGKMRIRGKVAEWKRDKQRKVMEDRIRSRDEAKTLEQVPHADPQEADLSRIGSSYRSPGYISVVRRQRIKHARYRPKPGSFLVDLCQPGETQRSQANADGSDPRVKTKEVP